jgi:hypothetical protein
MKLQNIRAFGKTFDIEVKRNVNNTEVVVSEKGKVIFKETCTGEVPMTVTL